MRCCLQIPLLLTNGEPLEEVQSRCFCIFTEAFFNHFGNIKGYPLFQPASVPVFPLSVGQKESMQEIYLKMQEEITFGYTCKYDILRSLVLEVIHYGT